MLCILLLILLTYLCPKPCHPGSLLPASIMIAQFDSCVCRAHGVSVCNPTVLRTSDTTRMCKHPMFSHILSSPFMQHVASTPIELASCSMCDAFGPKMMCQLPPAIHTSRAHVFLARTRCSGAPKTWYVSLFSLSCTVAPCSVTFEIGDATSNC